MAVQPSLGASQMASQPELNLEVAMKTYAPLFQPLKDLAKNWNVDLEKCLEGFVEWMKLVHEVERNSGGHFNFAQAALVVAGGAEVYGKKVDYVYQLALGFFEQLNEKAKKKKDGGGDGDNDENEQSDIPSLPDDPCEWVDLSKLRPADQKTLLAKKSACKPAKLLPLIPMELVPLTSEEKTDVPLYDSTHPNILIGMKDDFKMNTAFIHKSGAMLLDLINERIINEFSTKEIVGELTTIIQDLKDADTTIHVQNVQQGEEMDIEPLGDLPPMTGEVEVNRETQMTQPAVGFENALATGLLADDVGLGMECNPAEAFSGDEHEFANEVGSGNELSDEEGPEQPLHPADIEGFVDVDIEEIDGFTECTRQSLPEKVIRSYTLASNVIKRLQRRRVLSGLSPEVPVMEYMFYEMYQKPFKKLLPSSNLGFHDMPLIALAEIIEKESKRRAALFKARRKERNKAFSEPEIIEEAEVEVEEAVLIPTPEGFDNDEPEPEIVEELPIEEVDLGAALDNVDMDSNFRDVVHANDGADDYVVPVEEMSFNTRLRHYLNMYWAEGEEIHSKLDERVQKWDEVVTPLLEEEEQRRAFNIHDYGSELLEKFQDVGEQRGFFDLIREVPDYDVSRYFLSSLMLANTMNLEVHYDKEEFNVQEEVSGVYLGSSFKLTLLKRDRHHKAIERSVAS